MMAQLMESCRYCRKSATHSGTGAPRHSVGAATFHEGFFSFVSTAGDTTGVRTSTTYRIRNVIRVVGKNGGAETSV